MNGKDFIEMQKQDAETHKDKETLLSVVAAMEEVLSGNDGIEIDETKTAEECFGKMRDYAKENQKGGMYYFTPEHARKFIAEYLGVTISEKASEFVEIEDEPKPTSRKRRSLEDFF